VLLVKQFVTDAKGEGPMAQPLTMYTTTWCAFCKRLKAQLAREGIEMDEINIEEDEAAAEYVMSVNGGFQTVPTVLFADGSALTNPSAAQVKQRLHELAVAQ
jgi:mycoredoxin